MKCPRALWSFVSAGLGALFVVAANAQVVTGAAAVQEKIGPLLKGRTLRLASKGESAATDFHVATTTSGIVVDAGRAAGRDFSALRDTKDGLVLAAAAGDWGVAPSLERPGWLELVAGNQPEFSFNLKERNLQWASFGFGVDPLFNGRMSVELAEGLQRALAGEGVAAVTATPVGERWRLTVVWLDTATFTTEFDFRESWPVTAAASRGKSGTTGSTAFATGPSVVKAWENLTVENVYALGLPVRVTHQARLQWMKAAGESLESGSGALEQLTASLFQPFRGAMESGAGKTADEWPPDVKAASAKLATLLPPSLKASLETPPNPPATDASIDEPEHPLPGDAPVTVPLLRLNSTRAVIEVTIDKKAHHFLIDTGATSSMISDEASTRPVSLEESLTSTTMDLRAADMPVKKRILAEIGIGPWKLRNVSFRQSGLALRIDHSCSGLIGCDILAQHPFTMDWLAGTLTFHPRGKFRPSAQAKETTLTLMSGTPVVEASLSGIGRFSAMLDTGYSEHLMVKETKAAAALAGLRTWRRMATVPSGDVRCRSCAWPADRLLELPFGSTELPVIDTSDGPLLEFCEGVVGAGVLRHFRLTFDLSGKRLWSESVPDIYTPPSDPDKPDAFGTPPVIVAFVSGGPAAVDKLLAAGVVVTDGNAGHPAAWAATRGNTELAIRLMEHDRDGTWKKSAVFKTAVETGQLALMDWMLSHGVEREPNAAIISVAAGEGDIEAARRLRAAGFPFATDRIHAGAVAIERKQANFLAWMLKEEPAIVSTLIASSGASSDRASLLHIAAYTSEADCAKLLLGAGADPLLLSESRTPTTPLGYAAARGHAAMLRTLMAAVPAEKIADPSMPTLLHLAVPHPECVRVVLDAGVSPDAVAGGRTPLLNCAFSAVKNEDRKQRTALGISAVMLIRAGANVNVDTGNPSFDLVDIFSLTGLAEPLKLMLAKGLRPDGVTGALAAAAETGEVEVLRILLDAGADLKRPGSNGGTALMLAVDNGQTACVRELLTRGADARQLLPDESGNTLMHRAARFNDPCLLKLLADAGAPIAAPNRDERTPLHVAIDNRTLLAVSFLLSRGASPIGSGLSPAEMAEYLSPKYPALQEEVKRAAEKSGK